MQVSKSTRLFKREQPSFAHVLKWISISDTKARLQPSLFSEAMGISYFTGSEFGKDEWEVENSSLVYQTLKTPDKGGRQDQGSPSIPTLWKLPKLS